MQKQVMSQNERDIKRFLQIKNVNGLSQATIKNLEFIINGLKEYLKGKPFKETTEQDVLGFLIYKKEHGASPGSQRTYSIAIKAFYRFLYDLPLHQYPRQVLNLRNGNHTRKLPIRPEDVITKEDVAYLVKHCTNYRNEAIVVTLYESAARVGEFVNMNIGHLKFDDKGIVIIIEGKTGQRRIRLVESVPYIQKWLENHPLKDNKEAPLWCSLYSPYERIQEQTVYVFLKGLKKRTKFGKFLNPHAFRHSRLTELSKYLSDSKLKVFAGWAASSRMCGVYVHLSGSDLESDLLRIAGVETKEQKIEVSPLKVRLCPRCQAKNAGTNEFCMHACRN